MRPFYGSLFLALCVLGACSSDGTGPGDGVPHSIVITLTVDGEPATVGWWNYPAVLTATVHDGSGRVLPDAAVTWTSESPGLASVDAEGVVTFTTFSPGATVDIRARSGNATSVITIPVTIGLDSLALSPKGSLGMLPGATRTVVALRHLSNGGIGGSAPVTWSTSDAAVVDLLGDQYAVSRQLRAGSTGAARITAVSGRRADTLLVSVERPFVDRLVMGKMGVCAIATTDRRPWCWGDFMAALFGWETGNPSFAFPARPHEPSDIETLALGWHYACAISRAGALRCWNDYRDPGPQLPPAGTPWRDVATGWAAGSHPLACAVASAGTLWCWGDWQGATFTGGGNVATPRAVRADLTFRAVEVVTSPPTVHFCAIDTGDAVWCWGMNQTRQAGHPDPADVPALHQLSGLPPIDRVALGSQHTCALDYDREVWCWGSNLEGQLARDPASAPDRNHLPEAIEQVGDVVEVAAGAFHTCVRTSSGAVWCWGSNATGQLGQGDRTDRFEPVRVPGITARALAASGQVTCALESGAGVVCWGGAPDGTHARLTPQPGNPDIRTAP